MSVTAATVEHMPEFWKERQEKMQPLSGKNKVDLDYGGHALKTPFE
jgi:hypothetical protein